MAQPAPFEKADPSQKRCPICWAPSIDAMAPFCSKRCADVDLYRWLDGAYVVPDDEPGQQDVSSETED